MEAVGVVANVFAVVDMSAKVATLCSWYFKAVAGARDDISRVQSRVRHLGIVLQSAQRVIEGPDGGALVASRELSESLAECSSELETLQNKLEPSGRRKAMRRVGLRALKWPLSKEESEVAVANLERCENTISFGFQIDQTTILLDINKKIEGISLRAEGASGARIARSTVPFPPDPDFVDRPAIWARVTEQYAGPTRRLAVVGMGGFGKSQITIKFGHHIRDTSPNTSVFWIHGSSKARFEESYRSLADVLALPRRHDPSANVLALVRDWLQRDEADPWVMILDNANDGDVFFYREGEEVLASWLPKTGPGKIVITSRNFSVAERLTGSRKSTIEIPRMEESEALQLFRNKIDVECDDDEMIELINMLDLIPLAMTQAAAYINRRSPRASVRSYIEGFRKGEKQKYSLLKSDAGDLRRYDGVSNSVAVTWQITFDKIRSESLSAANLLSLMSFFHPQNIPEYLLYGYNDGVISDSCESEAGSGESKEAGTTDNKGRDEAVGDPEEFENDIEVLRSYSLISFTTEPGFFHMHQLVQHCTQAWVSISGDLTRWKRLFFQLLSKHLPYWSADMSPEWDLLFPHVQRILDEEIPTDESHTLAWCGLAMGAVVYMLEIGLYTASEELLIKVVAARKKLSPGFIDAEVYEAEVLSSLAFHQGRLEKAELGLTSMLQAHKGALGDDHYGILSAQNSLVIIYLERGRLSEAEELQLPTLDALNMKYGEDGLDSLNGAKNLMTIYSSQGRLDESEAVGIRALEAATRGGAGEVLITAGIKRELARTWWRMDRHCEAIDLMLESICLRLKIYGDGNFFIEGDAAELESWRQSLTTPGR